MGRTRIERKCFECNTTFYPILSEVKRGKGVFCSQECARPKKLRHHLYTGITRAQQRKNYKAKFPERVNAHQKVTDAIRREKLLRKPCEICGSEKSEAHHEDYFKPLDVLWLCRKHHIEADKRIGTRTGDFK